MVRVGPSWAYALAALLMSGCATPAAIPTTPTRGALSDFSIEYEVEGTAPFFPPVISTPDRTTKLRVDVIAENVHLDARLRPHETLRVSLSERSGEATPLGQLWVSRHTLGVVQASPFGAVPDEFGSVYHLRAGGEAWCFLGSGFFMKHIVAETIVEVESQGTLLAFAFKEASEVNGMPAFVMETPGPPLTRIWVDPSLPCPLRVEGAGYSVTATRIVRGDRVQWDATEPATPLRLFDFADAGSRGLPPDGRLPDGLFPIGEAFQVAQTDRAFRDYLSSHPGAVLVAGRFSDIQRDVQRNMLWSLSFSDSTRAGYEITVDRRSALGLGGGMLDTVVSSQPWTPEGPLNVTRAPAEGSRIATLASILALKSQLTTDKSTRHDYVYELHSAIGPVVKVRMPRMETEECLAGCIVQSRSATLSVLPAAGELSSFVGPSAMWRG